MGNLTRDPQVRYTPGGTAVAELGLAVNRTWFDKQANAKKEECTFVDVTLWGREAEVAGKYLTKGKQVFIEGRLQLDTWDDKTTGQKRSKMRVVCEHMQMLGSGGKPSKPTDEQLQGQSGEGSQETLEQPLKDPFATVAPADEVPF
jgi:single-strand DNA-binding protein